MGKTKPKGRIGRKGTSLDKFEKKMKISREQLKKEWTALHRTEFTWTWSWSVKTSLCYSNHRLEQSRINAQ